MPPIFSGSGPYASQQPLALVAQAKDRTDEVSVSVLEQPLPAPTFALAFADKTPTALPVASQSPSL